ncbi:chromosome partitioning protein ParA [Vibrio sp. HA2012]|nr:chromosome partitioning protein ParA [Vibrio sp. HA2012]
MVMINGINTSAVSQAGKPNRRPGVRQENNSGEAAQPTQLARAVSHSIRRADEADIERARVQYDLPEGHSRRAMQEYMNIFNQARKEELSQLVGVNLFI